MTKTEVYEKYEEIIKKEITFIPRQFARMSRNHKNQYHYPTKADLGILYNFIIGQNLFPSVQLLDQNPKTVIINHLVNLSDIDKLKVLHILTKKYPDVEKIIRDLKDIINIFSTTIQTNQINNYGSHNNSNIGTNNKIEKNGDIISWIVELFLKIKMWFLGLFH